MLDRDVLKRLLIFFILDVYVLITDAWKAQLTRYNEIPRINIIIKKNNIFSTKMLWEEFDIAYI